MTGYKINDFIVGEKVISIYNKNTQLAVVEIDLHNQSILCVALNGSGLCIEMNYVKYYPDELIKKASIISESNPVTS